ncbi:MAG: glycosyltransferase family 2 protein, partial [Thermodesulfobacteriota bacterium]
MKFSVVIPTRNRLEYLKTAVASVMAQDCDDWEIDISDNDSTQDVKGYVASLNDSRVRYSRTESFISVTENWNRALDQSRGDYVIVIGDDDCLMKGYFSLLKKLITKHSQPDLIFSNGLFYVYPGIVECWPDGHLTTVGNWHLWNSKTPLLLNREKVQELAKAAMNFKLPFSYNLQLLMIHRSLIEKLKFDGRFFHSPYPDYYAMTLLFQKSEKTLGCPYPSVVVGISPKSFGGYHLRNQENFGMETLNAGAESSQYPELENHILPGKQLNTCWLYALRSVQKNLALSDHLEINVKRYR